MGKCKFLVADFYFTSRRTAEQVVCYTAVFSVVTQRCSPQRGGALRDGLLNGCVADYRTGLTDREAGHKECFKWKPQCHITTRGMLAVNAQQEWSVVCSWVPVISQVLEFSFSSGSHCNARSAPNQLPLERLQALNLTWQPREKCLWHFKRCWTFPMVKRNINQISLR